MSATLVEFAEKFDILQSAIMHVCAKCRDADVENVSHKENRHAKHIAYRSEICGEHSYHDRADLVDDKRNDCLLYTSPSPRD